VPQQKTMERDLEVPKFKGKMKVKMLSKKTFNYTDKRTRMTGKKEFVFSTNTKE
jgi:hypothetical protein